MVLVNRNRTVMRLGAGFGYLAGFLNIVAFIWYNLDVVMGNVITNPVTWWLWLGETIVSLFLYIKLTKDFSKWAAEAVSLLGVATVLLLLSLKTFSGDSTIVFAAVEPIDYLSAIVAVAAFSVWLKTRKTHGALVASWVFQLAIVSAAVPLIRSAWADPSAEPFGPWAVWTIAFGLQTLCSGMRWSGFTPLLSPLNYTALHGIVALIVWFGAAS